MNFSKLLGEKLVFPVLPLNHLPKGGRNLLLLFLLLFSSCIREVDLKMGDYEPQLVINCLFTADSLFKIHLSESNHFLETGYFEPMTDAHIELYENGVLKENIFHDSLGFYYSQVLRATPGNSYAIRVTAPGFPVVEAEDELPFPQNFSAIENKRLAGINDAGFRYNLATIFIESSPGIQYYEIAFHQRFKLPRASWLPEESYASLTSNDEAFKSDNNLSYYKNYLIFTNRTFIDSYKKTEIINYSPCCNGYREPIFDTITVEFSTVSKEYYLYKRSLHPHLYNHGGDIWSGEPVPLYSNIRNGLGIFAGFVTLKDTFPE